MPEPQEGVAWLCEAPGRHARVILSDRHNGRPRRELTALVDGEAVELVPLLRLRMVNGVIVQQQEPPFGERWLLGGSSNQLASAAAAERGGNAGRRLPPPGTHVAHRRRLTYRSRPTVFLNVRPPESLGGLLGELGAEVERVFLIGPRPGGDADGFRAWFLGELPEGWRADPAGHYLEQDGLPVLRFTNPAGRRVELHRAAAWFGEGSYTPADAGAAWARLAALIEENFAGAPLMATAATTGRECWVRTVPDGHTFATLPEHLQEQIRATSGQGRIQLFDRGGDLAGLAEYDGRLMYGALCWGLGTGLGRHSVGDEWSSRERGRYRALVTVPDDWSERHGDVGLLPWLGGDGWQWPAENGRTFAGWFDGAELHLAAGHGWRIEVQESLVYGEPSGKPLDGWARKLAAMYLEAGDGEPRISSLVKAAIRSLLLHGIGAFQGRRHHVTKTAPIDQPGAVSAAAVAGSVRIEGDAILWAEPAPVPWPELSHPEWCSAVWARCRVRLLHGPGDTGALHVPWRSVVAMRTDALYLADDPRWTDDGAVGRLRRKSWHEGPLPWPRSQADLLRLRAGGRP